MDTMISETRVAGVPVVVEQTEVSHGTRIARYCVLDELSGFVIGLLTLAYILSSFAGLVP